MGSYDLRDPVTVTFYYLNSTRCDPPRWPRSLRRVSLSLSILSRIILRILNWFKKIRRDPVFFFALFLYLIFFLVLIQCLQLRNKVHFWQSGWSSLQMDDYDFVNRDPPSFERVVWFLSSFDCLSFFICFLRRSVANVFRVFIWLSGKI